MTPQERAEFEKLKRDVANIKQGLIPEMIENIDSKVVLDFQEANTTNLLSNGTTDSMKMPPNVLVRTFKNKVGLIPFYDISDK